MGIYDRDYQREPLPGGGFASMRMWSVTTWLIVINVAIFLLDQMQTPRFDNPLRLRLALLRAAEHPGYNPTMSPLAQWGHFSMFWAIGHLQVWRFLTFQFLHGSTGHLFGNMLSLYFFGPIVESHFGPRRYLAFYLTCGMAGAGSYLILWVFGILGASPMVPLVGASAGIFGILMAAAWLAPDVEVMLMFPPVSVKLKAMAWIMMGVAAYTVFAFGHSSRHNAGGEAAHLGGGLLALVFMCTRYSWNPFAPFRKSSWKPKIHHDWTQDSDR
jgi:membrane associated rhomboid family serine protease